MRRRARPPPASDPDRPAAARRAGPARGASPTSGCRSRPTRRARRAAGSTRAIAPPPPPPRSSRPSQSAIVEPRSAPRRAAMNGWRSPPGQVGTRGQLAPRGGQVAEGDQRSDPPLEGLGLDRDVAELPRRARGPRRAARGCRRAPSARAASTSRRARARALPIVEPAGHRDRAAPAAALSSGRPTNASARPSPTSTRTRSSESPVDRARRRLHEQLDRAFVGDPVREQRPRNPPPRWRGAGGRRCPRAIFAAAR